MSDDVIQSGEYKGLTKMEAGLAQLISDVSEECYCAGWMHDAEFDVWRLCVDGGQWGNRHDADLLTLPIITTIALHIDRWIVWNEDYTEGDGYYRAIPFDDWVPIYKAEMEKRRAAVMSDNG